MAEGSGKPALKIEDLHVYYGESHAIQGVSMTLDHGVLAVVGRNGMGKSTLCNTIAGLKSSRSGSIRIHGHEISRLEPHVIHRHGVGYVPQGRRVWPSLSVDEHLRLVATGARDAAWTVDRVYQTFPRYMSGAPAAARDYPAASSRCWRSPARCSAIRGF
jgi:ABC-type branched-subunit amino acid transport system ATPase component